MSKCIMAIYSGGTQSFLVGMCRADFQNMGLGSGFSLKNEGSWERKFALRAEILAKTKAENEMQDFSKN